MEISAALLNTGNDYFSLTETVLLIKHVLPMMRIITNILFVINITSCAIINRPRSIAVCTAQRECTISGLQETGNELFFSLSKL